MAESMKGLKRTHRCAELSAANVGEKVTIMGWVQKNRNKGGLVFVDVRDRSGIIQVVFEEGKCEAALIEKAAKLRAEYVVAIVGTVAKRSGAVNDHLATGEIEVIPEELRILSESETPPFHIEENSKTKEEVRLKYRYLDLRRPDLQRNLMMRSKVATLTRQFLAEEGFLEIETPVLIKSTPEGARDYLVPSRIQQGQFYALPQSPQLFKQLLMCSGYDRYFQIAKCFRDEDLRADRQPEFTQIDLEMSFVDEDTVMAIGEGFIKEVYQKVLNIDIPTPFRRMTWHEAMERFGSDKPDLRFGLELVDLSKALEGTEFRVFGGALSAGGSVRGINLKGHADQLSRKEIDKLTEWIKAYGAMGLAWTRLTEQGETSSYEKFLAPDEVTAVRDALGAETGDVLLLVASPKSKVVFDSLGALRCELAARFDLIDTSAPNLLWVTDFPLFEFDEEENRYVAMHHPFTAPKEDGLEMLETDPSKVCARAYDMVLNGNEVGGGSIRISNPELQQRMFKALGFTEQDAQERFGFLIDAFRYGAPPHGGMAFGLDRLVMLMLGGESIRDVIAFPKVANSSELMTSSPSTVDEKQLVELGIAVCKQEQSGETID